MSGIPDAISSSKEKIFTTTIDYLTEVNGPASADCHDHFLDAFGEPLNEQSKNITEMILASSSHHQSDFSRIVRVQETSREH
jgi:hypothetical protein